VALPAAGNVCRLMSGVPGRTAMFVCVFVTGERDEEARIGVEAAARREANQDGEGLPAIEICAPAAASRPKAARRRRPSTGRESCSSSVLQQPAGLRETTDSGRA